MRAAMTSGWSPKASMKIFSGLRSVCMQQKCTARRPMAPMKLSPVMTSGWPALGNQGRQVLPCLCCNWSRYVAPIAKEKAACKGIKSPPLWRMTFCGGGPINSFWVKEIAHSSARRSERMASAPGTALAVSPQLELMNWGRAGPQDQLLWQLPVSCAVQCPVAGLLLLRSLGKPQGMPCQLADHCHLQQRNQQLKGMILHDSFVHWMILQSPAKQACFV